MDLIWLIPVLPLIGFLINRLLADRLKFSEKFIGAVAITTVFLAFLLSVVAFVNYSSWSKENQAKPYIAKSFSYTWIDGGKASIDPENFPNQTQLSELKVEWAYQIDPLSGLYTLFITFVGLLIHIFAVPYLHGKDRFSNFFAYLNLFMFMMLTLVMGSNLLMTFVGWEGVGLCSYLLIGFYMTRKDAIEASKKAFIINRIGDVGFILAIIAIFSTFGTLEYQNIAQLIEKYPIEALGSFGLMSFISLGLFIGATGKSAQFPLYIWLPDAMSAPSPVSALIHAATMVTAGVYLLARMNFIFQRSITMMLVVALVGIFTAFLAATIAVTQTDIKKILAYSTVSQLGFMFLGCGVGAFGAAVFHVVTHAFFKAQLFLGAGSVIHAMDNEQDITRMGGLKKYLPLTHKTMLVSWLAICGIAPLSGFWSKDEILAKTFFTNIFHPAIGKAFWFVGFLTAGITAFYMTRFMAITFWSEQRFLGPTANDGGEEESESAKLPEVEQKNEGGSFKIRAVTASNKNETKIDEEPTKSIESIELKEPQEIKIKAILPIPSALVADPKEPTTMMKLPLVILAVFAATIGFIGLPVGYNWIENWLAPNIQPISTTHSFGSTDIILAILTMSCSLAMAYASYHIYVKKPEIADNLALQLKPLYTISFNKWYWDDLLDVKLTSLLNKFNSLLGEADSHGVDAIPNGSALITRGISILSSSMDKHGLDLLVNLIGWFTRVSSVLLRTFQTGFLNNYALIMVVGLILIIIGLEYQAIQDLYSQWMPSLPTATPTPSPTPK